MNELTKILVNTQPSISSKIKSLQNAYNDLKNADIILKQTTKHKLQVKIVTHDLKEYLKLKVFINPIITCIKQYVDYKEETASIAQKTIIEQLELHLITLDSQLTTDYCITMTTLIKLYIVSFPVTVWKSWIDKVELQTAQHRLIFYRFWSMFSQIINQAARNSKLYFRDFTYTQKQKMAKEIVSEDSLYNYIKKAEICIAPMDVLQTLLEAKGLSARTVYGIAARDLLIEIYSFNSNLDLTFNNIILMCESQSLCSIQGSQTLKNWLISNRAEEPLIKRLINYCLKFRRTLITKPTFINPITLCNQYNIPIINHSTNCKSAIKNVPLVAELIKPFYYKGSKINAISVVNMLCFPDTDLTVFDDIRDFQKLYGDGKIAVVCNLGAFTSRDYKGDIVFIDIDSLKGLQL